MIVNHFKNFNYTFKKETTMKNPKNEICFKNKLKSDVFEISGNQTTAKVFTKNIDNNTINQIKTICSHPVFRDLPIRIMPDTHYGKNVPVGFSAPIGRNGEIIPSLISGDIGCGMLCCEIDTNGEKIDFNHLDKVIRTYIATSHPKIPTTRNNSMKSIKKDLDNLCHSKLNVSTDKMASGLGTLGEGNHFIEIDENKEGKVFLVVHSGSRNFGQKVYAHHHNIATQQNPYEIPELSYLTGDEAKEYLQDMRIAQKYAQLNRRIIADEIIKQMGWKEISSFESEHNYIGDDNIIRKGAISANSGQKVIIPLNMRDGALIAIGKGNKDWNNSAPHGAGRKLSREQAAKEIQLQDYEKSMNGIYTTCVCQETLDESPFAYKNSDDIESEITPTVQVVDKITPKFNFKNKN